MKKLLLILLFPLFIYSQNNYCLSFDGGDYLKISIANYRATDQAGSISLWVKQTNFTAGRTIISSGDESSATDYFISNDVTSTTGYPRWLVDDPVRTTITGSNDITGSVWKHLVITSDGTNNKIYVNGSEGHTVNEGTDGDWFADIPTQRDNLVIGALNRTTVVALFIGFVDEVSIFSRALTPAEVLDIYNNGIPNDVSLISGLEDYWRFEEGTGTTTAPTVGNNTFTFGDGSTSSTYPTWTANTDLGWDAGDTETQDKGFKDGYNPGYKTGYSK